MAEQLKHITIAHNYSAKEAAAQFGLSYDDAQMYLEMLRRSGVLASTWVVPESGNYRWRIYHSVNSQKAPPDDDYIDVESNVVPFPIGAISAAKSQGEVIEFEYTVTDDDDF